MARIDIRRPHTLSVAAARKQADVMAEHLKEEFDLVSTWDKDKLRFERPGVEGAMIVSGADVHVLAELGFLVSFLKPKIESRLHAHFDEVFGSAEKAAKTPATKKSAAKTATPAKKAAPKPKR